MKTFLKIKIMSLAAEAKIIRHEEKNWPKMRDLSPDVRGEAKQIARVETRYGLYWHRVGVVRDEARSAQLAYGFLRGRTYRRIEVKCHSLPCHRRISELVIKFGGIEKKIAENQIREWLAEPVAEMAKAA